LIEELIIMRGLSIDRHTWMSEDLVTIHYLVRGKEIFCCIKDTWWQIWTRVEETPAVYCLQAIADGYPTQELVISAVRKVGPPENVVYSHSLTHNETHAELTPDDIYGMIYENQLPNV